MVWLQAAKKLLSLTVDLRVEMVDVEVLLFLLDAKIRTPFMTLCFIRIIVRTMVCQEKVKISTVHEVRIVI